MKETYTDLEQHESEFFFGVNYSLKMCTEYQDAYSIGLSYGDAHP